MLLRGKHVCVLMRLRYQFHYHMLRLRSFFSAPIHNHDMIWLNYLHCLFLNGVMVFTALLLCPDRGVVPDWSMIECPNISSLTDMYLLDIIPKH